MICNKNEIFYFDSFGVEHAPKEIKKFIGDKNIKANIFQVQEIDSIMCGYFCIGLIDFMLAGKKLTDFTILFPPDDLKKTMISFCLIQNWMKLILLNATPLKQLTKQFDLNKHNFN